MNYLPLALDVKQPTFNQYVTPTELYTFIKIFLNSYYIILSV